MIRALGYAVGFATVFIAIFLALCVLLLLFVGATSFITWSLPAYSLFNLVVFRLFVLLASLIAVSFLLSKEGREAIDEFGRSFKKGFER